jgi:glutamate N-acetyltransferase/amino-acid N-acetyltransferase
MAAALPGLAAAWKRAGADETNAANATAPADPADPITVAEAIMTTDSFPKIRSRTLGEGRILGIAKGAGMVEPNLATMLVFITTDITVPREDLREDLSQVVADSFNAISIDGDQSTSDTVLAWSSNRTPPVPRAEFRAALHEVCRDLAADIVRNGEGVGHVVQVRVAGARSRGEADILARGVANSPLVKTAIYGNDPNVGRIVAALGDAAGNHDIGIDPETVTIRLGAETIFADGVFHLDRDKERRLCDYLSGAALDPASSGFPEHEKELVINVDVARGSAEAAVLGTDLSYEYIRENADYRT